MLEKIEKIEKKLEFPLAIKEKLDYSFDVAISGLYSISISARAKSAKQINSSDDEDLQVEIDERKFSKIPQGDKPQYKDIAPAFNGSKLKGLKKTVMFFMWLDAGLHIVSFFPDNSAFVENLNIKKFEDESNINLEINEQAEDGDRRSWFAFVFADLSIKEIAVSIIVKSRWFDRDDAQIKIDGEIKSYKNAGALHRFWYWAGSLLKGKEETADFKPNLSEGTHYIEINADRMPLLKNISFFLGDILPKGVIADTNHGITEIKFRSEPKRADNIICEIPVGGQIEILEEIVEGEYITNMGNIWHKALYEEKKGYIISTYVDIEGKTQKVIKEKIIQEAEKLKMDGNLMAAIAKAESHFKPYAVSEIGAKGIFQLMPIAIEQLRGKNMKDLYYDMSDSFDIDQNINGGMRYFKWLYKIYYKGDVDALKKSLAAYNWGIVYVPKNIPFDQIQLPESVKLYIKKVLQYAEEFKQKGFSVLGAIFSMLLVIVFVGIAANALQFLEHKLAVNNMVNANILSNSAILESDINKTNVAADAEEPNLSVPRAYLGKNDQIVFADNAGKIVGCLDKDRLNLIELFDVSDNVAEIQSEIYLKGDILEQPDGVFYFFATIGSACGSGGCGYKFYKYNLPADNLETLDDGGIFGSAPKLFLSPDSKAIIILSHSNAGVACVSAYLSVFNLEEGKNRLITEFEDGNFTENYIEKVGWISDAKMEFAVENYNCRALQDGKWIKKYVYDIIKGNLTLINEEFMSADISE